MRRKTSTAVRVAILTSLFVLGVGCSGNGDHDSSGAEHPAEHPASGSEHPTEHPG